MSECLQIQICFTIALLVMVGIVAYTAITGMKKISRSRTNQDAGSRTIEQPIGEVAVIYSSPGVTFPAHSEIDPAYHKELRLLHFTRADMGPSHDDFIEILGRCHKKENVIFYDDIYNPARAKIKNRFAKKEDKAK